MRKQNRSHRQTSLEGAFTAIARAQSKHWGLNIVASGSGLCTDGETITFPWNADDIDSIPFQVLNGYLDHETGHVAEEREHRSAGRTTPMEILRKSPSKTRSMLLNVFEDIRMEIKRGREYPGVQTNLHAANLYSVKKFRTKFAGAETANSNFWHTLGCGIILHARDCDIEWMSGAYAPFMELIQSEIEESRTAVWGQDSWELACRVYDKVKDLAKELIERREKKAEEQDGSGDGDESEGGESSDDESKGGSGGADSGRLNEDQGEGQTESNASSNEQEGGEDPCGEAGDVSGESSEEGAAMDKAGEIADGAFEEATKDHIMDQVGEDIQRASEKLARSDDGYIPNPTLVALDKWIVPPKANQEQYNGIKLQVNKQISALRAKLLRIVQTRALSRVEYDRDYGRLDTANLHQLRLGSKRVFSRQIVGETLDTAVSVLVDLSGSMGMATTNGSRAYYARMAVIALAETFDALGVAFEIIGFHNTGKYDSHRVKMVDGPFINRWPFEYHVYKSFDDVFRHVRTRLVGITGREENADGEAVLAVAKRLNARPESRKLLFVISDGSPACPGLEYKKGKTHLINSVKRVRESGTEVFGIGVQHTAIARYYGSQSIVVNKLDDMAANIFKVIRVTLLEGLRRRAA